jgi:hypothetical protein
VTTPEFDTDALTAILARLQATTPEGCALVAEMVNTAFTATAGEVSYHRLALASAWCLDGSVTARQAHREDEARALVLIAEVFARAFVHDVEAVSFRRELG